MKFNSLEQVLRRTLEVTEDVIIPLAARTDAESRWPEEGIRALQGAGLAGLVAPRAIGGLGFGVSALTRTCEIIGRGCSSTGLCFGMHHVGTAILASKATSLQTESFLVPICEGNHLTTISLSEPGSGVHFYLPRTNLKSIGPDEYQISGTKSFVTNGGQADSYVVSTAATDASTSMANLSCVVVPAATNGLEWGKPWDGFGLRGSSSCSVTFAKSVIPKNYLLGTEGDQIWYVFQVVSPYFMMAMAGVNLGIAGVAMEDTLAHLKKRTYAFDGSGPGCVSTVQHRLGCLYGRLEQTRQLIYHAAHSYEVNGMEAMPLLMAAKAEVGDLVVEVTNEAMTLCGGKAYAANGRLARLMRDARAAHVIAPTTDTLRTWIGRTLLDLPLLGDG